jgi:CO/xanthine dehydrogenase Mo-binding subunit
LSPKIVEGQIEGSVAMGLGEALLEEHRIDGAHGGVHAGPNLLDYRMATALDTPAIHAIIVEHPDARGPYGAKEAGEGPLHPIVPAIASAIHDAVGVRMTATPFTPARVLAALDERARRVAAGACPPHKAVA